jgi:hypothetical protein
MSDESEVLPAKDEKGRFVTGNIGGGRPKGSRNKLGEAFLDALHEDFNEHGVAAIQAVRKDKPDQYLKVIASILPKELNVNVNDMDSLSDDEIIERLRSLDAAIRPFLAAQGEADAGAGDSPATTH